ncbi:MAG TPA: class I SAM-dependent methyltransferase [Humisphaera sp.]|nr:class I SAM-dependent methyltransferase [Humisphaera sp.]
MRKSKTLDYPSDACPACGGIGLQYAGPVYYPPEPKVAAVPVNLPAGDCFLKRCPACEFQFKFPPITEAMLLDCYAKTDAGHWGIDPRRRKFDVIKSEVVRRASGRTILDIGCFNGGLLEYFGAEWTRFGLEPSTAAAKVAAERGIHILGATIKDLQPTARFDVIVAIDVVEHILDPADFFRRVSLSLSPGGIFLILTGDTDAWPWRLQLSRYWYVSYLPEHTSFYSRKTVTILAERNGMKSVDCSLLSHDRNPLVTILFEHAKGLVFGGLYRMGWLGLPMLKRRFAHRYGTVWISAVDHMLHIMKREPM